MTANTVDTGEKPALTREVVARFARFHARNSAVFHIVLDDGNVADGHAQWCAEQATDDEGRELGRTLVAMSRTQRLKLALRVMENCA
jgi:hypothetical protein